MPIAGTEYKIPVAPSHTFDGPVIVPAAAGIGLTVIVTKLLAVHPYRSVTVTEYVVVTVGETVGLLIVPAPLSHKYE